MPEDFDYRWLGELLAHPERWSDEDAAAVRSMIVNQRHSLATLHPQDAKGRLSAQALIDQMEAALKLYIAARSRD